MKKEGKMMDVFKRLCIKSFHIKDDGGKEFTVKQGELYTTSEVGEVPSTSGIEPKKDRVVVFSRYWVSVPADHFVIAEPLDTTEIASEVGC